MATLAQLQNSLKNAQNNLQYTKDRIAAGIRDPSNGEVDGAKEDAERQAQNYLVKYQKQIDDYTAQIAQLQGTTTGTTGTTATTGTTGTTGTTDTTGTTGTTDTTGATGTATGTDVSIDLLLGSPEDARRLEQLIKYDPTQLTDEEKTELETLRGRTPFVTSGGESFSAEAATSKYSDLLRQRPDTLTDADREYIAEYRAKYGYASPIQLAEPEQPAILDRTTALMEGVTPEGEPYLTDAMTVTTEKTDTTTDTGQFLGGTTGQISAPVDKDTTSASQTSAVAPTERDAATYTAATISTDVKKELEAIDPATGKLSEEAKAVAAQMSPSELAQLNLSAAQLDTIREVANVPDLTVEEGQLVTGAKADKKPQEEAAQTSYESTVQAAQGRIGAEELINAREMGLQIDAPVQAVAASMDALNKDAYARAAQGTFDGILATAEQGVVEAMQTVQGQMAQLMDQFNNGTPAWAAGAMRAANAAMAARGIGGSSIAGAAIIQAAMESAVPIAQADAGAFQQMALTNLNNKQQVSLANAAAQQNITLTNLNNRQQAALQNSANAFALQSQNLSNQQSVVLANAQIAAAVQQKNLDVRTQTALANAARFAEVNNINLSYRQQANLQRSAETLQIETANLSNNQQTALANLQVRAALVGQELTNEQQARTLNAARISEIANLNFSADQQRAIENARLAQTVDLANLTNRQAKVMADAAAMSQMDLTNLNNRQQAAAQNAQSFLQMDLSNLSNQQQKLMFDAQALVNTMLSDQAAENAAEQFNATSENQVTQFFDSLTATISQFNANQANAISQYNAGQANAMAQFNANLYQQYQQYNASNALVVDQSNATWRRQVATADTAAINRANELNARSTLELSTLAYNNMWGMYKDMFEFAFQAEQADLTRANNIQTAQISATAAENSAAGSAFGSIAGSLIGGAFSLFSDMKLKTNIKEVKAFKNGIKMYTWDWKKEATDLADTRQKAGFIAQNVLKIYPDLVVKDEDSGYLTVNYGGVLKKCMA